MASALAAMGLPLGSRALPIGSENNAFSNAQKQFLSGLPARERQRFAPCLSAKHLLLEVEKFDVIANEGSAGKAWLSIVQRFADGIEPYFKIIDIFVSSHPEYAAIFWGSLRLVLQLADNYTTFFGKLAQLLATVTDALPQYEELLKLCVDQGRNTDDEAHPHRMQHHIEAIYEDIFRILHVAAGIFIKSDGSEKKALAVAAKLVWKPFEARFNDILSRMKSHRNFVFQQLIIWHASESSKEIARAAAERDVDAAEREDAARERRLAERERELMLEERMRNERNRHEISGRLDELHRQIRVLEKERLESAILRIQKWTSPPNFADRYERSRELRGRGTNRWLFDEKSYRDWITRSPEIPAVGRRFGQNTLWIQGHPGAGKTILAASVVEELQLGDLAGRSSRPAVYYYFFQHESTESCGPHNAFRSVLAQLLHRRQDDEQLLDRLTFMVDVRGQGQISATNAELVDALHLCLEDDSIFVLDGIDECDDSESLVESLVRLSRELPSLRIILLSRVNVPSLGRSVHADMRFIMPKAKIAPDIRRFFMDKLQEMMDDGILPSSSTPKRETLADRLCYGADGMFLWARLMSRCLCSPYMTREQRLDMIDQVNLPEGLEKMYERIVAVIRTAGPSAVNLASNALTWLAFSVVPITSRQLRQVISIQGSVASQGTSGDVIEFEGCVIMACAGLVEVNRIRSNPECPQGESALRFYHLSLHELINGISSSAQVANLAYDMPQRPDISFPNMLAAGQEFGAESLLTRGQESYTTQGFGNFSTVFQSLITAPVMANLILAACCLQHLSYHSPAQPLAGKFGQRVLEASLNEMHCFTSYAAVHWLSHLERCSELMKNSLLPSQYAVMNFIKTLSIFLSKPRVLSSWLEAFYTSRYQRRAVGYKHPPLGIVQNWIELIFMPSSNGQVWRPKHVQEVQETVHDLASEMEIIVQTWDLQLEKTPEIIWDEMTYFAKSKLFFSPESIKISIQEPEPPKSQGIAKEAVAKMSKTSADGKVKGILCIWAPHEIHDQHTFTKLRVTDRNQYTDIRKLCTGWIATYHVWRTENPNAPAAKIQMNMEAEDVLGPLRKYLDYAITDGLDFPLAISADALSVCILRTVYTIFPGTDESNSKISSQRLSENKHIEPDFIWTAPDQIATTTTYYYNFYFSETGQFLLLHESIHGCTRLVMYECSREFEQGLVVAEVNELEISNRAEKIGQFCFHPSQALLIFSGIIYIDGFRRDRTLFAWRFENGRANVVRLPLTNSWSPKSISFSSCGNFLVIQRDFPSNAQPEVIKCPGLMPENGRQLPDSGSLIDTYMEADAQSAPKDSAASSGSKQIQKAEAPRFLTQVDVSNPGTEISLAQKTKHGVERTKILTLPKAANFEGIVHTAIAPQPGENMFKISVDMDRRPHYSLLDKSDIAHAAVIERHRAYAVPASNDTAFHSLTLGEGSRAICGLDLATEWKAVRRSSVDQLLLTEPQPPQMPELSATDLPEGPRPRLRLEGIWAAKQGAGTSIVSNSTSTEPAHSPCPITPEPPAGKPMPTGPKSSGLFRTILDVPAAAVAWLIPKRT